MLLAVRAFLSLIIDRSYVSIEAEDLQQTRLLSVFSFLSAHVLCAFGASVVSSRLSTGFSLR